MNQRNWKDGGIFNRKSKRKKVGEEIMGSVLDMVSVKCL